MWTTALQIGQLVDTAQKVFDTTETRILISHASPGREGILAQLALVLKVKEPMCGLTVENKKVFRMSCF